MRRDGSTRFGWLVPAIPTIWLGLFFLVPLLVVLRLSFSDRATAQPPYTPVFSWGEDGLWASLIDFVSQLDFENYELLTEDSLYLASGLASLRIAAIATFLLFCIGYPIAHAIARAPRDWRGLLVLLVMLPFWTSFLIRIYAWVGILKPEGLLNAGLMAIGLIEAPLEILNTETAILIGIVYAYLPFMILPIYAALDRLDPSLVEAAQDLGASPLRAFWKVTFRLSLPGVIAGALLCFIPAVGEVVIPDLLGGSDTLMIGKTLWSEFFGNRDWPLASAVAVIILIILVGPIMLHQRLERQRLEGRT
jgi:putrescine transport system permease protein